MVGAAERSRPQASGAGPDHFSPPKPGRHDADPNVVVPGGMQRLSRAGLSRGSGVPRYRARTAARPTGGGRGPSASGAETEMRVPPARCLLVIGQFEELHGDE